MLFLENIKIALSSIKANKMRSFLTMLGIIIGISSVIAITSIGASAQALVSKEFDSYGKNMMYIYINWNMVDDYIEYKDWIFNDEIAQLKERFGSDIQYVAPYAYGSSDVKVGRVSGKVEMNGVAEDYNKSKNMNLLYGRMINESDIKSARENIVIEKAAAVELFNRVDVTGEVLNLNVDGENRDMTIVGVFEVERTIFSQLSSGTYEAYVPYPLLQNMGGDGANMVEIYVNPDLSTEAMAEKISNYLCLIKDQEPGFYTYETAEGQGAIMDSMLGTLSMAIGAIAAISLLVGGIGIMNIMLVSVTERTREIGVRKSLGARTKDILQQFLIESMILSAIGGAIGVLLGTGIVALGVMVIAAAGTDGIEMVISPAVVAMAVGFSALVGMFFGLFPARKAAKLDPIEALRYE